MRDFCVFYHSGILKQGFIDAEKSHRKIIKYI